MVNQTHFFLTSSITKKLNFLYRARKYFRSIDLLIPIEFIMREIICFMRTIIPKKGASNQFCNPEYFDRKLNKSLILCASFATFTWLMIITNGKLETELIENYIRSLHVSYECEEWVDRINQRPDPCSQPFPSPDERGELMGQVNNLSIKI